MLSRLERTPITTKGVNVEIDNKLGLVTFLNEKTKEKLSHKFNSRYISAICENDVLEFTAQNESAEAAMHLGTAISISISHAKGLLKPFTKGLILKGTGYKVVAKTVDGKQALVLTLGKSHDDLFMVPAGVKVTLPSATQIVLESANKQLLGQTAAKLCSLRKVDRYKGKGVLLEGVVVTLKETKKKK